MMIKDIKKAELKQFQDAGIKLEVWTKIPTQYWEFSIVEANSDSVKIDFNHFLAWKDLTFEVEVVEFKN